MKVKRYTGNVNFISIDDHACYGKYPFDFYHHDYAEADLKARRLAESSEYNDPRIDHFTEVDIINIEEVDTVKVHMDVVVHISIDVPIVDESPSDLAEQFIAEMDYEFKDTTGKAFNIETPARRLISKPRLQSQSSMDA